MGILNIAHRGYSGKFDENTMLAFNKAIEYKADGIETDVQLSKDGIPVLIHDETLERTTNGYGFVKDHTLNQLKMFKTKSIPRVQALKNYALEEIENLKINLGLRNLNHNEDLRMNEYTIGEGKQELEVVEHIIGKYKEGLKIGKYTIEEIKYFQNKDGEEIPTLRELLELVANSNLKVLNLELKNSVIEYEGLEEKVLAMVDEFNLKDRVIISSFNHLSLVKIRNLEELKIKANNHIYDKSAYKGITLGALTDSILANVPGYLKDISVECYHPYFPSILNKDYMKEIRNGGIKVNPYTVNEPGDMKKVIEAGADSIITNEVELLYALTRE